MGINPSIHSGTADAAAAQNGASAETDKKVAWIKEAAGDGYADLEINLLQFAAILTDDRKGTAEMMAPLFGLPPRSSTSTRTRASVRSTRSSNRSRPGGIGGTRPTSCSRARSDGADGPRGRRAAGQLSASMTEDPSVDLAFAGAGGSPRCTATRSGTSRVCASPRSRPATRSGRPPPLAGCTPSPAPTTSSRPARTVSSSARRRPSTSSTPSTPSPAAPGCCSRSLCAPRWRTLTPSSPPRRPVAASPTPRTSCTPRSCSWPSPTPPSSTPSTS